MNFKTLLTLLSSVLIFLSFTTKVNGTSFAVTVLSSSFSPANLVITAGDTVVWTNVSGFHSVDGTTATWPSNPVSFGNSSGSGWTYSFTFATAGSYEYRCGVHSTSMFGTITVNSLPVPDSVFINEIHYENTGADSDEGVEVAGPAGTDLSCYSLLFYNGSDSLEDPATTLSGIIPDKGCGYGVVWFPISGLQNDVEGIGLQNTCQTDVVQFLSYEGTMTALDGPASGMTSVDIGVSESGSTAVGMSLQLIGTGNQYVDFTWAGPISATPDKINGGQIFCTGDTIISFVGNAASVNEDTGTFTIELSIINPSPTTAFTVDVVYSSGSATIISDFTFSTQTVTFPANDSTNQTASITIIDDTLAENGEDIILMLQNASAGITLGPDSVYRINIKSNDIVLKSCSDLFFSEYVEGTSYNKAIEVYNPRIDTVDLSNYTFLKRTNGTGIINSYTYSGMLAPDDVFVIVNSSADSLLKLLGDTLTSGLTAFNGNDPLVIVNTLTGDTIDKFGEWGVDPGLNWPVDTGATKEFTLVRKAAIQQGNLYWIDGANEWDVYPQDDWTHLGSHDMTPCAGGAGLVAAFSSTAPACLTNSVCFTDLSTTDQGSVAAWIWDFGDGDASILQNPCHTYLTADTFTVSLTAIDVSSNIDSAFATVIVTPLATVDAGPDQLVCPDGGCIPLAGTVSGLTTTGMWTTLGTGTFSPDDSDLAACYTPSTADTAAGIVCLVLTSTNNGNCSAASDTVCLTFNSLPRIKSTLLAIDSSSCGNSDGNITGITAAGVATLTFDWVDGGSNSVDSTLSLLLVPSGCYTLTVTDGNSCTQTSGPHCVFDAGAPGMPTTGGDGTYCEGDTIADLTATGSGGTLYWFSDAALTDTLVSGSLFVSGATATDTFYVAELGSCLGLAAQVIVTVNSTATVDAGADTSVCEGDGVTLAGSIGGSATASTWTTAGDGSFDDSSMVNATYTPGSSDVSAGTIVLTLTSDDPAGPCPAAADSLALAIYAAATTAAAGPDQDLCDTTVTSLAANTPSGSETGTWSVVSGTGSPTSVNDPSSSVTGLTIGGTTVFRWTITPGSGGCPPSTSDVTINVDSATTVADAGPDQNLCNTTTATLAANSPAGSETGTWTTVSGTGSASSVNDATSAVTGLTIGDTTVLSWTITSGSGGCSASTSDVTINVGELATANAGPDAVACGGDIVTLGGSIGGSAASSMWTTSGDGTFDDAALPAATYTPGSADIAAGTVTLTLTTDDPAGDCVAASDDMVLTPAPAPVAAFTSAATDLTVDFMDASTISSGSSITSWAWNFGDGNSSIAENPSNTYTAGGTYNVCLTVTTADGCSDMSCDSVAVGGVGINELDLSQYVDVFPNPTADGIVNVVVSAESFGGAELQVFNLYGEIITSFTIAKQGVSRLDLSGQSAGIYVINIISDHGTVTKRIAIF